MSVASSVRRVVCQKRFTWDWRAIIYNDLHD